MMIDLSLLEDFVIGAGESLEEMESALLSLESQPNDKELLNTIFRAMHTIKGAAQFVGLEKVSKLSHIMEDLLDLLREGKKSATLDIIALFIQAKDRIGSLVSDLESSQTEKTDVEDLILQLNIHLKTDSITDETKYEENNGFLTETDIEENDLFLPDNSDENLDALLLEKDDDTDTFDTFLFEDSDEKIESFLLEDDEVDTMETFLFEDTDQEIDALSSITEDTPSLHANNPSTETVAQPIKSHEFILPNEEHDEELFEIFILQLREKFVVLNNCVVQLEMRHFQQKEDTFDQVIDILKTLKFSANYMAYEELTYFYSGWIHNILDFRDNSSTGQQESFAFMREYLHRLENIFPQLNTVVIKHQELTDEVEEEEDHGELAFIHDVIAENEPITDINTVDKNKTLDLVEDSQDHQTEEEAIESPLFKKLSSALDASILEQAIISEPINEVFSALLNSTQQHKPALKQERVLALKTLDEVNSEKSIPPSPLATPKKPPAELKIKKPPVEKDKPTQSTEESAPSKKIFKKSIRIDADKIDSLMNQVGELIVDRSYFFQLATEIYELQQYLKEIGLEQKDLKRVKTFSYRFSEAIISLGRTSNALQEGVMKVRMLPMTQLFNRFPRLVHDVANTNNKKVRLDVRGEETELDKMIIEEIADPLMHMIRNAIGHGIEPPEERIKVGKPETGQLILEAYHESNHIVIEITDDGRGIDIERIKTKAEQIGLFTREELNRMSENDLTSFIMMPGFSTAKEINNTSGRGVGMDVVKKNIEKLNGTIDVESKKGIETKMRLKIPLTLAIISALLVKVGIDTFTIPLTNVEETLSLGGDDISIMEDVEVMYLRKKTVPIFRLATLFSLKSDCKMDDDEFFVVIVNTGTQRIGLMVDSLLGQEEVVIKPLADYLYEQNCFSGATIIRDGCISLILDVYELISMTTEKQIKKHHQQEKKSLAIFVDND